MPGLYGPFMQTMNLTAREKHLIEIYRLEAWTFEFPQGATEEERLNTIRVFHEEEVDREYRGKGYRVQKWFSDEFLRARWKDQ